MARQRTLQRLSILQADRCRPVDSRVEAQLSTPYPFARQPRLYRIVPRHHLNRAQVMDVVGDCDCARLQPWPRTHPREHMLLGQLLRRL